jgi:hypothetical protein
MKYLREEDIAHLIRCIKEKYELNKDLDSNLCVTWMLNISMPGYIIKQLQKYKHASLERQKNCSYASMPKQYGSKAQRPLPPDTLPPLSNDDIKHVQQITGSILYYTGAVDLTMLMALSMITSKQAKGRVDTMVETKQLLNNLATHPNATVRFHASNMILNIHSDASYLLEANALSQACGHFFMGWRADPTKPIKLNGAFFTLCAILRFVVASPAEAKLSALFLNCKQATIF